MVDHLTPEKRSRNMARIGSRNTAPERAVRSLLHRMGFRFRLHRTDLPGSPDIVMPKYRVAIFVDGCFWHRHPGCKRASMPKTNRGFWEDKFAKNVERDSAVRERLRALSWRVLVVWQCEVADLEALATALKGTLDDECANRACETREHHSGL